MATASELTYGMVIRVEGQIYRVLKVESKAAAGKLGGVVKAELSNTVTVASGKPLPARGAFGRTGSRTAEHGIPFP